MSCNYRKKYKYDHESDVENDYVYKYKDNYEPSYLDDYTTSAISYEESIKRQHITRPYSKSEYGVQRHRESKRHKSPIAEHDNYFKRDDSIKRRSTQTKNDMQNVFYQFEIEKDKFKKIQRQSQTPRSRDYYEDSITEGPQDEYEYDKYLEKTRRKGKIPKNYEYRGMFEEDRRKSNKRKNYSGKENDYQVFSYREPKFHEKVFKRRDKNREKSPQSSEIEIKTTDYPILAFKENNISQKTRKTSSVLYLPTVYCQDKKYKSRGRTKHRTQSNHPGDTQVFAADINQEKNIFTQEKNNIGKHNSTDKAVSELQTEESSLSRDTKLKGDSTARASTETQTEESLIFDNRFPINQSYKNTGSILGTILERVQLQSKLSDNNSLRETKRTQKYGSPINNKNLFAYQIDVDIEPVKKNVFEYKEVEGPLHDHYPVTKDYIKVSDNSSIQIKPNMILNATYLSETSAGTLNDLKNNYKQKTYRISDSHSKERKYKRIIYAKDKMATDGLYNTPGVNELVIKNIPENILDKSIKYDRGPENENENVLNSTDLEFNKTAGYSGKILEPQDIHIFRSTVNNTFKNSMTQRSSIVPQEKQQTSRKSSPKESTIKSPQMDGDISNFSMNRNQQSKAIPSKFGSSVVKGNEEMRENPEQSGKERMSAAKQRGPSLIGDKNESVVRESRVENQDTFLGYRKSKSAAKESRGERPNQFSSLTDITNQPRDSRVEEMNYAADTNNDINENKPKSLKNSQITKPKTSKSILRNTIPRKKSLKPDDSKNITYQEGNLDVTDNVEQNEQKSELKQSNTSKIKNKSSKTKLSKLFSRSKSNIESENEMKNKKKSGRQTSAIKSGEYIGNERKSRMSSSRKSKTSRTGKENDENTALSGDSQTQSRESVSSKNNRRKKSKSKILSYLSRPKSKTKSRASSTKQEPGPEHTSETPGKKQMAHEKRSSVGPGASKENADTEEKHCECIVQYVKQARECGNFFLGTSLHEQIMDILKVV